MKSTNKTEQLSKQKKKLNEKDVTKDVQDWAELRKESVRLFRMQTTGIPDGKGGFRLNNEKGSPDFIGAYLLCKIPVLFAFEIKSPSGKQSDSQRKWQKRAEGFGINYFIIKSWQEAEAAIQKIHKKHRRKIAWTFLGPSFKEHAKLSDEVWHNFLDSHDQPKRAESNPPRITEGVLAKDLKNQALPDPLQDSPVG